MTSQSERRHQRSTDQCRALTYQLEHTRQRGGMTALALANGEGLLLAAAGDPNVCEELSALAPFMGPTSRMPCGFASYKSESAVCSFDLHGEPLFLACLGGGVARDALLRWSAEGVQRILGSN